MGLTSQPPTAEVKNVRSYTCARPNCFHGEHRDSFVFLYPTLYTHQSTNGSNDIPQAKHAEQVQGISKIDKNTEIRSEKMTLVSLKIFPLKAFRF